MLALQSWPWGISREWRRVTATCRVMPDHCATSGSATCRASWPGGGDAGAGGVRGAGDPGRGPGAKGLWDIVRQLGPFIHDDRSHEGGAGFNNHNVEKLGVTINLRTERGKDLLRQLVTVSDAVTENFAAGVMDRLGFGYEDLRKLRSDIVYVSNCGFGQAGSGPYSAFKSWGPIAQAVSGLTWSSGLPDAAGRLGLLLHGPHGRLRDGHRPARRPLAPPAPRRGAVGRHLVQRGGYALRARPPRRHRQRSADAGAGRPNSNRSAWPEMAPHGIYPAAEADLGRHRLPPRRRLAGLAGVIGEPWDDRPLPSRPPGRPGRPGRTWPVDRPPPEGQPVAVCGARACRAACGPALGAIDVDPDNAAWGLWPEVVHTRHGR